MTRRNPGLMVWYMPEGEEADATPPAERRTIEEALECGVTAAAEWIESFKGGGKRWHAWGFREMGIATEAAIAAVAKYKQLKEGEPDANTATRPAS
jgi:hypothetical protein